VHLQVRHQLHVLSDGIPCIATHRLDELAGEEAERAGDDEQAVDAVPADASDQKGAEVLDHLHRGDAAARQAELSDTAAFDLGAVRNPHDPARRGDDLGVVDDGLDDP
jgi:hypothetical protein